MLAISDEISACRTCPRLVDWRETIARDKRPAYAADEYWGKGVPPFGDPHARVVIVGLAPAAHGANRTGRMFTGDRSGDWLFRALHRAGFANQPSSIDRDDGLELTGAFVTSPVKCAPPANKPTIDERDNCRPYLDRELAVVDGRVFVALGAFGFGAVCAYFADRLPAGPKPKFAHGVEVPLGTEPASWILGSYHVSQQNTFTGRLTEVMLDEVFARARQLAYPD